MQKIKIKYENKRELRQISNKLGITVATFVSKSF